MSDLFSKVSELLSDPESARKIQSIASSLSGENPSPEPADTLPVPLSEDGDSGGAMSLPSFDSSSHSREVNLLNAIRPYLRTSRVDKVDRALKAIRVIDLLSRIR